jgi:adenylate kinase
MLAPYRTRAALAALLVLPLVLAAADRPTRKVILMVGPPGSGKTTQSKRLSRKYGLPSINMADVLKRSAGFGKAGGGDKALRAQIESGELVEDSVANSMIRTRLLQKDTTEGFILDGYPATANQAAYLEALLKERGLPTPVVIHLTVSDEVARKRMQERRRADDKPAIIEARLAEYHHESDAALSHFQGDVITIDAEPAEVEVWRAIEAALAKR